MPTVFARLCSLTLCCLAVLGIGACSDNSIAEPELGGEASGENRAAANAATPVTISDLQVATGYKYVVATGLEDGARAFIDRTFVYEDVPLALQGHTYIRTRQGDKEASPETLMSFRIDREAVVYIAYEGTPAPWIAEAGFEPIRDYLLIVKPSERLRHYLFAKVFPAGRVELGANDGSRREMYTVIVRPTGDGVQSVNAGGPYSGAAGTSIQFAGSAQTVPELDLPLTYTWDFGDGHTGAGPRPTHTYTAPGTYTAQLHVSDALGNTVTATAQVNVGNAPARAASQVSAGDAYACALRATGVVECWGQSEYGEAPASRTASTGRFVEVATHKNHTCALRDDGAVECWGNNGNGRAPALKTAATGVFTQVGVGQVHSCALRDDGVVECWGGNGYGQAPPTRLAGEGYFTQLAVGDDHTCALRIDGAVDCWGQLASTRTATSGRFVQVTAGDDHTCALRNDGVVECWFLNQYGQAPPTRTATTGRFVAVSAGGWHTCALRSDGVAECWGGNGWGQAPATQTSSVGQYHQLNGGYYFNCAVRSDYAFECWGRNKEGQARSEQRIVFTSPPPNPGYVGGRYPIAAVGGGSGSTVKFSSVTPGVCTLSGWTVWANATGTCTIAANQAGNSRYFPAPEVQVSFQARTPQTPSAPTNLSATAVSGPQVRLRWTDTSDREDSFRLMRRQQTSGGTWGEWGWIASPPQNAVEHTDSNVVSGLTYQYGVRACAGTSCTTWVFSTPVTVP
ncbi:MAG TPA: PKD domain-containing protein [Longimicrobiaceae bacterium]